MYFGDCDDEYESEEEFMFGDGSAKPHEPENITTRAVASQQSPLSCVSASQGQLQGQTLPAFGSHFGPTANPLAHAGVGRGIGRGRAVSMVSTNSPDHFVASGSGISFGRGRGMALKTDRSPVENNGGAIQGQTFHNHSSDYDRAASSVHHVDRDLENMKLNNPKVSVQWLGKLGGSAKFAAGSSDGRRAPRGPVTVDQDWLNQLEDVWLHGNRETATKISKMLLECFNSTRNPYVTALYLLENAKGYKQGKTNGLSFSVAREFEKWARLHQSKYTQCLDEHIKLEAFHVGTRYHFTFFDFLVKSYQLAASPSNQQFLIYIQQFIEKQKLKEAAQCSSRLGLQDYFHINDIVLPLLLQDKVNLVETYVCRNHKQQLALVKLLDHFCDEQTDIGQIIHEANVPNVKRDKLQPKVLTKLAIRLMKLYQIPQEQCPNISNKRSLGGLRYIMYKKYIEQSLSTDTWDDLVMSSVGDNPWLQEQLVQQLVSYLDMVEAARWAIHYKVPQETLPPQVVEVLESGGCLNVVPVGKSEDWAEEDWGSEENPHYSLHLPWEATKIITTREGFHLCVDAIVQPGSTVGIDSEWRPTLGQDLVSRVALLQLALADQIFLLDALALVPLLQQDDWQRMADSFWSNEDVLKLGYGIDTDLQMLLNSIPELKKSLKGVKRVVDLAVLHRQLARACPEVFKDAADNGLSENAAEATASVGAASKVVKKEERGLSELVRQCLGKPLDKSQQMSDWERRPLRNAQITYAALDAFCLLEVYQVMKFKVKQLDLEVNLEPCINEDFGKKPRSRAERAKHRVAERPKVDPQIEIRRRQRCHEGPAISPGDLHVVCDNMLQGLGKQLRCCGVDVSILDNNDDHNRAAEIARREGRIILTSGGPYFSLRSQVAEGRCLNVTPGTAREQVVEVLDAFNVKVTYRDIFSRCQLCNGNRYLHICPSQMEVAWHKKAEYVKQGKRFIPRFPEKDSCEIPERQGEFDNLDLDTLTIGNGVMVQVETVPEAILHRVNLFYVCATCGKVFWEGKHFERVCEQFSHVLGLEDQRSAETIYSKAQDLLPMQK